MALRIPPPIYAVALAGLMWLVSAFTPALTVPWGWRVVVAALLLVVSVGIGIAAVIAFHRARTTIHPLNPAHTSTIVTTGVYRFSRNPMYLAMLVGLLAIAVLLGNVLALVLACCFVPIIEAVQIRPEERILAERFDPSYQEYCGRVRRWI